MRNLFFALLLANLIFAAWQLWFAAPEPAMPWPDDSPALVLASERPAATRGDRDGARAGASASSIDLSSSPRAAGVDGSTGQPSGSAAARARDEPVGDEPPEPAGTDDAPGSGAAAAVETPVTATADTPARCISLGPFRDLPQVEDAAAALRDGGYVPEPRATEGEIFAGYWVYIDAIASMAQANAAVARLVENGVADAYVIPGDDTGNIVSLGVFNEIARAGVLSDAVRRLGYDPVITDRTRQGTVYWLDVALNEAQALDLDLLQSPGRILRLEQRRCGASEV